MKWAKVEGKKNQFEGSGYKDAPVVLGMEKYVLKGVINAYCDKFNNIITYLIVDGDFCSW